MLTSVLFPGFILSVSFPAKILVALFVSASLAGCSTLPGNGPDSGDFAARAVIDEVRRYEILDVNSFVVSVLAQRPQDSLLGTFGDYRAPIDPRIGIGVS